MGVRKAGRTGADSWRRCSMGMRRTGCWRCGKSWARAMGRKVERKDGEWAWRAAILSWLRMGGRY